MIRRPKPGETEEDLLRMQEEFLSTEGVSAANVTKKGDKRKNVADGQESKVQKDVVQLPGAGLLILLVFRRIDLALFNFSKQTCLQMLIYHQSLFDIFKHIHAQYSLYFYVYVRNLHGRKVSRLDSISSMFTTWVATCKLLLLDFVFVVLFICFCFFVICKFL